MVRRRRALSAFEFSDSLMEEAYGGDSDVIISCESGRRSQ